MKKTIKEYRFSEKEHLHQLLVNGEWKDLTGVTSILQVIAKPALIQWSANQAVDYIRSIWLPDVGYGKNVIEATLEEARKAHRKKKEEAGKKGTDVHAIIEQEIKEAIEKNEGLISEFKFRDVSPQVKHFIDWAVKNKVKFLESEKHIWSREYFLGGILDGLIEIDGQIWLMDLKTSKSGLYAENFWQCAGYEILLNECSDYKKIKGYVLINLKNDGEFLEKRSISNEEHKKAFLACLEIYRQKERTNNGLL